MLRLLHTSDWHLGQTLHDHARDPEHVRFLRWLLETLVREQVDALLVAGDVFDTANPSADAQRILYDFLVDLRGHCPRLDVVIIGGNHDSASRLDAPRSLFEQMGVRVVGGLPRRADLPASAHRLIVPLTDAGGNVAAHVAAVPFIRTADLPPSEPGDTLSLADGVGAIYAQVLGAAREQCTGGQALVAMGHCYMVGSEISEMSERRILGGNQHALPVSIFPDDVAYVALGHLHKPQRVGGRDHVRYSGSPLPMSLSEADYPHQVCLVDLHDGKMVDLRTVRVPRSAEIWRVPRIAAPLDEVVKALRDLRDACASDDPDLSPFLEVRVRLDRPEPTLRSQIEDALQGKWVRLASIHREAGGNGESLADQLPDVDLTKLDPEDVFLKRYKRAHDGDVPEEILQAFREVCEAAQQDGT